MSQDEQSRTPRTRRGVLAPLSLNQFQRVIPVAQTASQGEVIMVVLSIDVFRDGFVVNMRMETPEVADPSCVHQLPRIAAEVRDDWGECYTVRILDKSGTWGTGRPSRCCISHEVEPALSPLARKLMLMYREEGSGRCWPFTIPIIP